MRFGVIGCGTVAECGHIPGLTACSEAELVALSDVRDERLHKLGKKHGVSNLYNDYRALLAHPGIEAVTVATPLGSHYEVVMSALHAGKHVFCEKPLAASIHQGKAMTQAAEQAGVLLAVNFEMRAGRFYRKAKNIVESGQIGRVRFIRMVYNWAGPRWAGNSRHQTMMTEGMGPIVDCGVHFFDLARWFTNSNYRAINAAGINMDGYSNPDHVVATCALEDNTLVIVDESWVFGHAAPVGNNYLLHRTDIEGEKGTITIERSSFQSTTFHMQTAQGIRTESGSEQKAFDRMYSSFVESTHKGRLIDLASGADGVAALEAALCALQSVANSTGYNPIGCHLTPARQGA